MNFNSFNYHYDIFWLLRCLVAESDSICKYSCKALGYETGTCDENEKCNCGEERSTFGKLQDWTKDKVSDFFGK